MIALCNDATDRVRVALEHTQAAARLDFHTRSVVSLEQETTVSALGMARPRMVEV